MYGSTDSAAADVNSVLAERVDPTRLVVGAVMPGNSQSVILTLLSKIASERNI